MSVEPSEPWRSPKSGNAYPQAWAVRVAGGPALTVRSRMPGQELTTPDTTGVDYFAIGALTHSAPALDIGLDLQADPRS